jgi:hypothetical protein
MLHRLVALSLALSLSSALAGQCANVSLPWGSGCGLTTPFGIPFLSCVGAPTVGNLSFALTTSAPCVSTCGFLLVGPCLPAPVAFPFGYGAGGMCGPSEAVCLLHVDPCVALPGVPTAGGYSFSTPIPNDPGVVGLHLCAQGVPLCSAVPCLAATQGVSVTVQ